MSEVEFPTREELEQSGKVDVRDELSGSNPFLRNSWLGAIVSAFAFLFFDWYEKLKELLKQFFFDTAENPYLNRWSAIWNIITNPATKASGGVVAEGTPGSPIAISSKLAISGISYRVTLGTTINAQSLSVTSLTRFGGTVTAITASNHNLATGINVTIAGAVETEYNGVHNIAVIGLNSFTYPIQTTPTTPATGTITADFNTALVSVEADTDFFGVETNQISGAELSFSPPLPGVNNSAFVDFNGLTGGADQEETEDQRIRFLERVQNPVANFNKSAIVQKAKEITGNTRIFVNEITPAVGQVTIYFTRDNDGIIPTAGDVTRTKEKILEIKPANTADADVIVLAPTEKQVNFIFSSLVPNTTTMQSAVNNNLDVLFEERTAVGQDLTENEYKAAIQNTIDTETGEKLISFSLTTPSGDIAADTSAILIIKGTVTFPI